MSTRIQLSDRKLSVEDDPGETGYYLPDVVFYGDYYSAGMLKNGRHGQETSIKTRYKHQGQYYKTSTSSSGALVLFIPTEPKRPCRRGASGEGDDEINGEGNSYAYEYRMSDPRTVRFWSLDPLAAQYAYNSPYAFSENILIHKIELEGLESAFDIRSRQNDQAYLRGEISRKDWEDFYRGSAMGAAAAGIIFVGAFCPSCAAEITRLAVAAIMTQGAHKMAETTQDPVLLGAQEQGMLEVPVIGGFSSTLNSISLKQAVVTAKSSGWNKLMGGVKSAIRNTFTQIKSKNIDQIEEHFNTNIRKINPEGYPVEGWADNNVMLERLRRITSGEIKATKHDKAFYRHELTEKKFMDAGMDYDNAHSKSMRRWGTSADDHYTPEANQALEEQLRKQLK